MVLLSILIPTVPNRIDKCSNLLKILNEQIIRHQLQKGVEVISYYDNKVIDIGTKRNKLIELANGEFFCFIDDDDTITDDYLFLIFHQILLNVCVSDLDCITFDVICRQPMKADLLCKYSKDYSYGYISPIEWHGKPAHLHVWRKERVKDCKFPSKTKGEDMDWVAQAYPLIRKEDNINKVLYYYNADVNNSETQR